MAQRPLFGGAIVATIPTCLLDVSDLRQVPDNQEVFLYPDSNASIIIEVLERVAEQNDLEAIKFHFGALAHDNNAVSSTMQHPTIKHRDLVPSPITLRGSQYIRKFNAADADNVDILIALFRVCSAGKVADLVVSASIPRSGKGSVGRERADTIESEFNTLISSFRIIDYDLFCSSSA